MDNGEKALTNITVEYGKFKKLCKAIERENLQDEDVVTFELIVGSLFPTITENIKKELLYQHTQGYVEGLAAAKNEEE